MLAHSLHLSVIQGHDASCANDLLFGSLRFSAWKSTGHHGFLPFLSASDAKPLASVIWSKQSYEGWPTGEQKLAMYWPSQLFKALGLSVYRECVVFTSFVTPGARECFLCDFPCGHESSHSLRYLDAERYATPPYWYMQSKYRRGWLLDTSVQQRLLPQTAVLKMGSKQPQRAAASRDFMHRAAAFRLSYIY
jgi:hypothetical protein